MVPFERRDEVREAWVSVDVVAAHLGVREDSICRWIERRGLPAQKSGKLWRFKLSEVDAWLRAASGPPVLVVDDDESLRDTSSDFLGDEGFTPMVAAGGKAALELLRSLAMLPAVIVLDLHMPQVNGWSFRAQQAADPRLSAIPVIVLTAERRAELTGPGALQEPTDLEALLQAVRATMGSP